MQPNNQQGYTQPDPAQPVQPVPTQPVALQPLAAPQSIAPVVDPAALQAALSEPIAAPASVPAPASNTPPPTPLPTPQTPVDQPVEVYDSEEDGVDLSDAAVSWVAHEYIHQEKGTMWFVLFAIVIAALIALSIFLMNSWSFAVLLAVIAVVVVIYSRRPPRELTYSLTDDGLYIDNKLHKFEMFKSFGIVRDGEEFSVMLIPTQRFQPGITVYFPEESGEAIVDILGSILPMKDLKLDAVDRIVRLLRL